MYRSSELAKGIIGMSGRVKLASTAPERLADGSDAMSANRRLNCGGRRTGPTAWLRAGPRAQRKLSRIYGYAS